MAAASPSVRDDVRKMLEQVLSKPVELTPETRIVEDLGMDSLAVMNFVMAVEDHYDISIPLDRVAEVQTIGDLVEAIEQLRGEA